MRIGIIMALLVLLAVPAEALTYKWVDNQGNENYTDDLGSIPQKYRKKARVVGGEEEAPQPAPVEPKEGTRPDVKAKGNVEPPAEAAKEQKKVYGGKSAETWYREFSEVNADLRATEDRLAELNDRMKDTSKMSRGEYLSIQTGIKSAESRLKRLREKRDALNEEANRASVPAELRPQ